MSMRHIGSVRFTKVAIVIILAVGIVGGGRLATHSRTPNDGAPSRTAAAAIRNTSAVVPAPGTSLDLKALGAHLLLGDAIKDAVYAPFEIASTDGSIAFGISAQSLMNQGNYCSAASGPLGLIIATS